MLTVTADASAHAPPVLLGARLVRGRVFI